MSRWVPALLLVCFRLSASETALIDFPRYRVVLDATPVPALVISSGGQNIFRLPVASGLSTPDNEEVLSQIAVAPLVAGESGAKVLSATAVSSLWTGRRFTWKFFADHVEFQQFATGDGAIERCYVFSNGISDRWTNGKSQGVASNTTVYADRYFSPRVNHADQHLFSIAMPQSVGIAGETAESATYDPLSMDGLFVPPPLALAFHRGEMWTTVGIGTEPGNYRFNALEYSGSRYAGASFWVNEQGRATAAGGFASPVAALHFGADEFDALTRYVAWVDASGFGTQHRVENAPWHRLPIFCGWAEQTVEGLAGGLEPHDLATQKKYEEWIAILEQRGLPVGTVVIDDKWQKHYGMFDVDEAKWPDLKGFIDRQHARHRHVLLWVPAAHREGLPPELCVRHNGRPIAADVSNPQYEALLRKQIKHLVNDLGVDGFKEDWISGIADYAHVEQHAPLYGIEFLRRFQFILFDETHRWRPDALIETQTPNPLFRESSDVLRLNDLWYGTRDVPAVMTLRARLAHLAGWPLVDCDNASSTDLEEWWKYMQLQPSLGIPALYFVHSTESTKETVSDAMWSQLAEIWKRYVRKLQNGK